MAEDIRGDGTISVTVHVGRARLRHLPTGVGPVPPNPDDPRDRKGSAATKAARLMDSTVVLVNTVRAGFFMFLTAVPDMNPYHQAEFYADRLVHLTLSRAADDLLWDAFGIPPGLQGEQMGRVGGVRAADGAYVEQALWPFIAVDNAYVKLNIGQSSTDAVGDINPTKRVMRTYYDRILRPRMKAHDAPIGVPYHDNNHKRSSTNSDIRLWNFPRSAEHPTLRKVFEDQQELKFTNLRLTVADSIHHSIRRVFTEWMAKDWPHDPYNGDRVNRIVWFLSPRVVISDLDAHRLHRESAFLFRAAEGDDLRDELTPPIYARRPFYRLLRMAAQFVDLHLDDDANDDQRFLKPAEPAWLQWQDARRGRNNTWKDYVLFRRDATKDHHLKINSPTFWVIPALRYLTRFSQSVANEETGDFEPVKICPLRTRTGRSYISMSYVAFKQLVLMPMRRQNYLDEMPDEFELAPNDGVPFYKTRQHVSWAIFFRLIGRDLRCKRFHLAHSARYRERGNDRYDEEYRLAYRRGSYNHAIDTLRLLTNGYQIKFQLKLDTLPDNISDAQPTLRQSRLQSLDYTPLFTPMVYPDARWPG
ncbi:hypothetical protein HK101_004556, partial [Irineochytrium annulatum]